jgi:hypothetical protein
MVQRKSERVQRFVNFNLTKFIRNINKNLENTVTLDTLNNSKHVLEQKNNNLRILSPLSLLLLRSFTS